MKKIEKSQFINQFSDSLKEAKSSVFVNFSGMDVKLQQNLKRNLKESGATMVVAKNTLIRLAGEKASLPKEALTDTVLSGQTAVVLTTDDSISPVQVLGKFAKENEKPEMKAGVIEGIFQDKVALLRIATLPSKEVLYAQVVGSMSAPMYAAVGVLQANLQKLLWILKAKSQSA